MENNFNTLDLSKWLLDGIEDIGFEEMSPIQRDAIPVLLEGKDLIGQAQTGTGKTAAFGIPMLEMIDWDVKNLQGIVLVPTRELAIQVSNELNTLAKHKKGAIILPVYGGQAIDRQLRGLRQGAQIVVGTPGRVMDHMRRRSIRLENIRIAVLDEADEMFDMGFREDMDLILGEIHHEHQVAFFSATIDKKIVEFSNKFQTDPTTVRIAHKELTVANIEQYYFDLRSNMKTEILSRLLDIHNPKLTIVFCNTKKMVDELTAQLQARGYFADGLHGDLKQVSRDVVMRKFREGTIDILVATDVAARGIDVDDVDMVVNYDLPQDEENYVHRIGRTARAGRTGAAYSFVVGRDIYKLKDIMRYSKANIKRLEIPKLEELRTLHNEMLIEELKTIVDEEKQVKYKNIVDSLMLQDYSSVDIAAALLYKASTNSKLGMHEELDMIDNSKRIEKRSRKERGDRDDRDFRDKRRSKGDTSKDKSSISRVFISLGKKDNISPRHLLGLLEKSTDLSKGSIKDIDIYDSFSFADVKTEITQDLINAVDGTIYKGKPVRIERAARSKNKRK